ncbi:MAG: Cu2+-exporting ATPase [Gammaproteobacteria bacterium]|jgi:Cu2+-exporting ATPase
MAQDIAQRAVPAKGIILSLPHIHCAGCIRGVEKTLLALPEVAGARVNMTTKRVAVDAQGLEPEDIVATLAAAGYEAHPLDQTLLNASGKDEIGRALLLKLSVAGFAMMNVMLFSVAVWSGASQATQVMFHWLSAAIAVPALAFSAQVFVSSAIVALKAGRLNMDVPISLAIILAAALSVYETSQGNEHVYFDAALSLTFFLLIGRYLDHKTRFAARSASQELSALEVPRATRITDGFHKAVDVCDLRVGDTVLVAAGMRAPIDGTILNGTSDVDRSLITGESRPTMMAQNDAIAAGELNLTGPLTVLVTAVGADTTLQRMAAMVAAAESGRNRYTALADRAAQIYAPAVHLLAAATFIGWYLVSADAALALRIAISVLIITCPCALGLAAPAVIAAATGRLFRRGLLVKDSTALERLAEIDTVIFDKTGTLTIGQAHLDTRDLDPKSLAMLAGLCQSSQHPVSRAIASALPADIRPVDFDDMREIAGCGVESTHKGQTIRLGRGDWVGAKTSPALRIGDQPAVPLQFSETLKDGAAETIKQLQAAGFEPQIFSGDTPNAVLKLAAQLGDIPAQGNMSPDDKYHAIAALADQGKRVLMVGDGLNDTAALTRAYASISPASALDASRAASDIVVLGQSLSEIPEALRISRSARRRIVENFTIAAGYNLIAVPVAILGFASPLAAAIAMSASSITVLANALRVR